MTKKPSYKISNLPMHYFDFIVMVDANEKESLIDKAGNENILVKAEIIIDYLTAEAFSDVDGNYPDEIFEITREAEAAEKGVIEHTKYEPCVIWSRMMGDEDEIIFGSIADLCSVVIKPTSAESYSHLHYYFRGLLADESRKKPINVAVVGATLKNGIPQMVRELETLGDNLRAFVIPRYCLSGTGVENINEILGA